jgi:hypothetical protein
MLPPGRAKLCTKPAAQEIEIAAVETEFGADVAAVRPSEFLKFVAKHRDTPLHFGIVGREIGEHADAPHPIGRLRARRARPRSRRAKEREKLTPPHASRSPHCVAPRAVGTSRGRLVRTVCSSISVARSARQVFGADLNRSESRSGLTPTRGR